MITLSKSSRNGEAAQRTILWAGKLRPSAANVQSTRSPWQRRSWMADTNELPYSPHVREYNEFMGKAIMDSTDSPTAHTSSMCCCCWNWWYKWVMVASCLDRVLNKNSNYVLLLPTTTYHYLFFGFFAPFPFWWGFFPQSKTIFDFFK